MPTIGSDPTGSVFIALLRKKTCYFISDRRDDVKNVISIARISVEVKANVELNSSRGVIFCRGLSLYTQQV